MRITRVSLEQLDLLVALFDQYRRFYKQGSDIQGAREFLSRRIARDESVAFMAFGDSEHQALGFVQLYPSFSSVAMKPIWILNDLFVIQSARRQNVAEALIHQAVQHAKETGSRRLVLETAADNTPARRLYEKLGWTMEEGFLTYRIDF